VPSQDHNYIVNLRGAGFGATCACGWTLVGDDSDALYAAWLAHCMNAKFYGDSAVLRPLRRRILERYRKTRRTEAKRRLRLLAREIDALGD